MEDNYQIVVHVNRLRKWNGDPKSLKDKAVSMENMNPTISPDVNNETTVPTVAQNNSENENLNKNKNKVKVKVKVKMKRVKMKLLLIYMYLTSFRLM